MKYSKLETFNIYYRKNEKMKKKKLLFILSIPKIDFQNSKKSKKFDLKNICPT